MPHRYAASLSEIFGRPESGQTARRKNDLFNSEESGSRKVHVCYQPETDDGLNLPTVIVPDMNDLEDFYATVATFYPERSPISAFVHVIGEDGVGLLRSKERVQSRVINRPLILEKALLGASLGEAVLHSTSANELAGAPTYASCRRSFSFAVARAFGLYGRELQIDELASNWSSLREISRLPSNRGCISEIVRLLALATGERYSKESESLHPALTDALSALLTSSVHETSYLSKAITHIYPFASLFFDEMKGPFDGRMAAFTRFVKEIQNNSRGNKTDEIAVAFACDCILPGSFSHAGALVGLINFFPTALIWYGCISSLAKGNVVSRIDPGLVLKLNRDLVEDFSFDRRPKCDISLDELRVILRAPSGNDAFRLSNLRILNVALMPGVEITTRVGAENEVSIERSRREAESVEMDERAIRLLEEALYTVKRSSALKRGGVATSHGRKK